MSFAITGATIAVGAYGAHEQKEAASDAIDAQGQASATATAESGRQFDIVREDTRIARETGDQAMVMMGYLMGTRKPPSDSQINSLEQKIENLKGQIKEARKDSAYWGGGNLSNEEYESRRDSLKSQIESTRAELEKARMARDIAGQMGGKPTGNGGIKPPDINALFDNVDLPTGENIGSPDSYIPDLDNFLQGLGQDLENSRGYQFELKQGREALQAALAQKGTAYGGNAIKEALTFSQDYASTKYGERFGQAMQEYDREYQSGMTRYGMDLDSYNRERQEAFDQYGMNMDKYRLAKEQDDTRFGRLATMAGYGPVGTQVSANAGQNYAQTVANSNQNLASTIGQGAYSVAGANTQALSNAVNTGMTMYQYNRMMDTMGG